jgi:hypothetical protein
MGWEVRRGKRYYYRSRRENGLVVKEYFGCGPEAEEAARQDAEAAAEKFRRQECALKLALEVETFARLDDSMKRLCDAAVAKTLGAAGYHKVRGQWRKKYRKRKGAE